MPNVLVPLTTLPIPPDTKIPLNFVRMTYVKTLVRYHLAPVFISPAMTDEMIQNFYRISNGVLLAGGPDVHPRHYGQAPHLKDRFCSEGQDELELKIVRLAIEDRKPILGICRGCQMLAVACGGTLHQHLPDLFPEEEHGVGEGGTYENLFTRNKHFVVINKSSQFFSIFQNERIEVNTGHHQAVDCPGNNLKIVGRSPAGVAEIIEHVDQNYFCFGIQSHPEAEEVLFEPLFREFQQTVLNFRI